MELEIVSDSSVRSMILKRKRSQRQRPCGNLFSSSEDVVTTTSSSLQEMQLLGSSTEYEDQEVANCLILLAKGEYELQTDCNSPPQIEMLRSRTSWLDQKIGVAGVYDCKTCNRSFHSFQALGGHKASHKKVKFVAIDEHLLQKSASRSPDNSCHNLILPIPALQLVNNRAARKIRIHQCLICCAEFPSGQALGGHMRKHRVNIPLNSSLQTHEMTKAEKGLSITLSLTSPANEDAGTETSRSNSEFQCLDLNFPASSEDEMSVTRFCFASNQSLQDSGLVPPGPALVDCHY